MNENQKSTSFDYPVLVFDLDGTLYQTHKYRVYRELEENIFNYIANLLNTSYSQAKSLSEYYQERYGSTVLGLKSEHNINPNEFLDSVYDVSFDDVTLDIDLFESLRLLPNTKIVFTNATEKYTQTLLEKMGVAKLFHDVFDIYKSQYSSKPNQQAFDYFKKLYNLQLDRCVFIDDRHKNLEVAARNGAFTLLCSNRVSSIGFVPNQTVGDIYSAIKSLGKTSCGNKKSILE